MSSQCQPDVERMKCFCTKILEWFISRSEAHGKVSSRQRRCGDDAMITKSVCRRKRRSTGAPLAFREPSGSRLLAVLAFSRNIPLRLPEVSGHGLRVVLKLSRSGAVALRKLIRHGLLAVCELLRSRLLALREIDRWLYGNWTSDARPK
jgi:hypothetical protein